MARRSTPDNRATFLREWEERVNNSAIISGDAKEYALRILHGNPDFKPSQEAAWEAWKKLEKIDDPSAEVTKEAVFEFLLDLCARAAFLRSAWRGALKNPEASAAAVRWVMGKLWRADPVGFAGWVPAMRRAVDIFEREAGKSNRMGSPPRPEKRQLQDALDIFLRGTFGSPHNAIIALLVRATFPDLLSSSENSIASSKSQGKKKPFHRPRD